MEIKYKENLRAFKFVFDEGLPQGAYLLITEKLLRVIRKSGGSIEIPDSTLVAKKEEG